MTTLRLDEETHLYTYEGRRVVGTTEALSLVDTRPKDPFYLDRGKKVHMLVEYYNKDILDEESIDPQLSGYFSAYKLFLLETGFKVRLSEEKFYDPKWQYAGKIDVEGAFSKCDALVDVKSGGHARVDELQGAAYWNLFKQPGHHFFDLYLSAEGTYKLIEVKNPRLLFPTFCAVLTAYKFRENL